MLETQQLQSFRRTLYKTNLYKENLMEYIGIVILSICIVFVVQLFRVAFYLKRVNKIDRRLVRVIAVLVKAPFNKDLKYLNRFSKLRVVCIYYWGIASGNQFTISKIRYYNNGE